MSNTLLCSELRVSHHHYLSGIVRTCIQIRRLVISRIHLSSSQISNGQLSISIKSLSMAILALLLFFLQLNNWLIPWSRIFLQKLLCPKLVKKSPVLYGTRRFLSVSRTLPFVLIPNQINPIHAIPADFVRTHFNIIIPFKPPSSIRPLSVRYPYQNSVRTFPPLLPAPCLTPISLFLIWLPPE
jgi:hypothetical protein